MSYHEEKACDALAFEPLPSSQWVSAHEKTGILIRVRYSEPLSRLLRSLPKGKWDAEQKQWRFPFSSSEEIRRALPEIERLATLAQDAADKETERHKIRKEEEEKAKKNDRRERERRRAMAQPRPLQPEYMDVLPNRPRFVLRLEAIADNLRSLGPIVGFKSRCWVARIFGSDGRGGWARVFVEGARDYSSANSVGSRGVYITYFLEEGPIYEVSSPQTWKKTDRYFLRIVNGKPQRLTKEEVEQCLTK